MKLDPKLVDCLASVSSNYSPFYCVVNFSYTKVDLRLKRSDQISVDTEFFHQRTRWGLLALYGYEVRRAGFDGWLSSLIFPEINIEWGLKILARMALDYSGRDLVAAFNFGSPKRDSTGYVNQTFVDDVYNMYL